MTNSLKKVILYTDRDVEVLANERIRPVKNSVLSADLYDATITRVSYEIFQQFTGHNQYLFYGEIYSNSDLDFEDERFDVQANRNIILDNETGVVITRERVDETQNGASPGRYRTILMTDVVHQQIFKLEDQFHDFTGLLNLLVAHNATEPDKLEIPIDPTQVYNFDNGGSSSFADAKFHAFNERIAQLATDTSVPLLERLQNMNRLLRITVDVLPQFDWWTRVHCINVARIAYNIGVILLKYGPFEMTDDQKWEFLLKLSIASQFHDIGKYHIPKWIINKPSRLTDEEFSAMKTHVGEARNTPYMLLIKAYMPDVFDVILRGTEHHYRPDHRGYTDQPMDGDIDLITSIISAADATEAKFGDRPYSKARRQATYKDYRDDFKSNRGTQFDGFVIDSMFSALDKVERIGAFVGKPGLEQSLSDVDTPDPGLSEETLLAKTLYDLYGIIPPHVNGFYREVLKIKHYFSKHKYNIRKKQELRKLKRSL